jgi:hypothetical protein
MERLALQPVPDKESAESRIGVFQEALNAKLEMLTWLDQHLPEHLRGKGVTTFDRVVQLERVAREQENHEARFWRWLAARFYFLHFGTHMEEIGDARDVNWSVVKIAGNVYDITGVLRQKAGQ